MTQLLRHTHVSAAYATGLAVRTDGTVVAWGINGFGQASVPAGLSGVTQVETGGNHTLALKSDGTVVGWGLDEAGQASSPPGLADVTQVSVGWNHSMALRRDGSVVAWGDNNQGQANVPVGMAPAKWITAGHYHCVAVLVDGTVAAWGYNFFGQTNVPAGLSGVDDADASERHTLARRRDGSVVAWGSNGSGQCAVPDTLSDVVQVAAGDQHSLALRAGGSIVGWGSNIYGECNMPANTGPFVAVSAGEAFSVGILQDGQVRAWGLNTSGQAQAPSGLPRLKDLDCGDHFVVAATADGGAIAWGYNGYSQCDVPVGLSEVVQVAAGSVHSLALRADGSIVGWGSNSRGQCVPPDGMGPALQIAAENYHSVALTWDGTVVGWGWNTYGQLTIPPDLFQADQVDTGTFHVIARSPDGMVRAWGRNNAGQCSVPASVNGAAATIGAGEQHTLAALFDGTVVAWGRSDEGQCEVPGELSGVVQVSGGWAHSVALRSDGAVVAWGAGAVDTDIEPNYGQTMVPAGLTGVTKVVGGYWFTMALLESGRSGCGNPDGSGSAVLAVSGSAWQEVGAWDWSDSAAGPQVPGVGTSVSLGSYGSVGSDCQAQALEFQTSSGTSVLVPAAASSPGNDYSIRVGSTAQLAGRLWLLGVAAGGTELPIDLNLPVLSAALVQGSFDLIQTDVPPPAGYFLTLVPEDVNGRTVLSLRLLPLPGNAELEGANAGNFVGTAVAAETIDINHDGFDDLALAVSFGPSSNGLVQILLNDGAGNLGGSSVLEITPPLPTCLAVGDVNNDGDKDVVVGLAGDLSARVYVDDGSGGLTPGTVIAGLSSAPTSVIVIPPPGASLMAGSASVGVGLSGSKLQIYQDSTLQQEITMAGTAETVRGGNTGGTQGTDIVTGGSKSASVGLTNVPETGFVQVLRRQGNGQYAIVQTMFLTAKPRGMDVADLDGDGLDDIVTANADPQLPAAGSALPVLSIFRNIGGVFGGAVPYQPAGASSGLSVSLVDADSDGDRDIVSVHRKIGVDSEAALLRVDTLGAGTPITVGQTTALDASNPILSARGNLDGFGGDDLYLVDAGTGNDNLRGSPLVRPYLGVGGLEGDLDRNGAVDYADVAMCLLDFGPCPGCASDLDGNEVVDYGDVALVLLNFG